jgi:hypothetical protein
MKTSSLFVVGLAVATAPADAEKNKKPASYAECMALASKQGWGPNAAWGFCNNQGFKN